MAKLVVISPALKGLSYELGKQWVTIGRAADNVFQVLESSVSGHHCEVLWRGHELVVRDMNSTNGTFVGGAHITEAVVKPGDAFRLGDLDVQFESSDPVPVPVPTSSPAVETRHHEPAGGHDTTFTLPKVLLVDDSMAFLENFTELFDIYGNKAWKIYKASAADQALLLLQKHRIAVVVLDLNMPILDGAQLLGILHRRYPEVKKVVLTGHPSESRRAACLANGAELFLEKPTSPEGMRFIFNILNDLVIWSQRDGFSGTLRHVGLTDVIQIQCLSGSSCILEVHNPQTHGEIFIEGGSMVYARTGVLSGTEALYRLLSLPNGEFHLKPFQPPPERSVHGSWEFLLMEAARLRDEEDRAHSGDDTILSSPPTPIPG
jgi:CheY-like chemotaxis protein